MAIYKQLSGILAIGLVLPWYHQAPWLSALPVGAPFIGAMMSVFIIMIMVVIAASAGRVCYIYSEASVRVYMLSISYMLLVISSSLFSLDYSSDASRLFRFLATQTALAGLIVIVPVVVHPTYFKTIMWLTSWLLVLPVATLWLDWATGSNRASGWLADNPNYAAHKALPIALFFLTLLVEGIARREKTNLFLVAFASLIVLPGLIMTGSGAASTAFAVAFLVYLLLRGVSLRRAIIEKKIVSVAIAAVFVLAALFAFSEPGAKVVDRMSAGIEEVRGEAVTGSKSDITTRLERDLGVISRYEEWGLLGVGPGMSVYALDTGNSHNNYLQAWAEIGVLGVGVLVTLVLAVLLIPSQTAEVTALRVAVFGIAVHMLALGGHLITSSFALFSVLLLLGHLWERDVARRYDI